MRVLVVNAGSSSLKLDLVDGEERVGSESLDAPRATVEQGDVAAAVERLGAVDAVGHRIVHGGDRFTGPVLVDDEVRAGIAALGDLAPLHQRKSLGALDAVRSVLPDAPAVASFDTAFHAGMPAAASTYPIPREWRDRWGLRRFGFHGLSVDHATRRAAELTGRPVQELRTVVCHIGAGASVTAVDGGRSVDTSMGFTPLEGLAMATRSGSVDPGLVLWLLRATELSVEDVQDALEHGSGLLGMAGTKDMREVLERAARAGGSTPASEEDADAALALGVVLHRLRAEIARMAAAMAGLDVLVFTGGVGEHAAEVRDGAADGLAFLGVALRDEDGDEDGDREITAEGATVRSLVVRAREDLVIAREVRETLAAG
jgi:acetate kinase